MFFSILINLISCFKCLFSSYSSFIWGFQQVDIQNQSLLWSHIGNFYFFPKIKIY